MVKKTVSIIIPNYNGAKLLVKNLPKVVSAAKNYSSNTEIIVVDDGSTDNSIETLKTIIDPLRHSGERSDSRIDSGQARTKGFWTSQNDANIKIITKEENEGFSSTCNEGVKNAKGDIIVLLNTDIWPQEDFLKYLVPHFQNSRVFAVGCLDKSLENGKEIDRGRGIGCFKNGFLIHARGEINQTNTLWVSGGSSAYNKKIFVDLGGFDEVFNPFYWEDIDLSYRAQKRGYKIFFEPKAIVHHQHDEGAIKSKYSENQVRTIAYRNQFLFVWKNITDGDFILEHLILLPWYLIKALFKGDSPFIIALTKAALKLPKLFYYRATVCGSNSKCISDKEILAVYKNEF